MNNAQIKHIVVNGIKLIFGKGPDSVKTNVSDNIIFLDIQGSLTALETNLLRFSPESKDLIKQMRKLLFDGLIPKFLTEIRKITEIENLNMENYMFDIDFQNDRIVIVFIFSKSLLLRE